jgi:hypothetical protein
MAMISELKIEEWHQRLEAIKREAEKLPSAIERAVVKKKVEELMHRASDTANSTSQKLLWR